MMTPIGKAIRLSIIGLKIWLLSSCGGPYSLEELHCEGEVHARRLASDLRAIQNKEELQKALPLLKKRFNKIADLVIEARAFPKEEREMTDAGEELFLELARLYELPGGRELIENAQTEAIHRISTASKWH